MKTIKELKEEQYDAKAKRPEVIFKILKLYKKPLIGEQRWRFYSYICT